MFIHLYLFGCNYFWMLCEGIYLHTLIVVAVFAEKQHLVWYYLLGWGESKGRDRRSGGRFNQKPGGDEPLLTARVEMVFLLFACRLPAYPSLHSRCRSELLLQ